MVAVAISKNDEDLLIALQKILAVKSKSQLIHQALTSLQKAVLKEKLAEEIRKSVKKCGKADLDENTKLSKGALSRFESE